MTCARQCETNLPLGPFLNSIRIELKVDPNGKLVSVFLLITNLYNTEHIQSNRAWSQLNELVKKLANNVIASRWEQSKRI